MKEIGFSRIVLLYLTTLIVISAVSAAWYQRVLYSEQHNQIAEEAQSVSGYFNNQLERYHHIPQLLNSHYQIRNALQNTREINALNLLLLDIAKTSGASEVYVLNRQGDVVAASNFQSKTSFVGGNYAFRPYFYQAMQGEHTKYYALGLRSGERGVFFSSPIIVNDDIIGVAAVKVNISKFEQDSEWLSGATSTKFMVFGPDDIIFMSSFPYWRLKQLRMVNQVSWDEIQKSQRYLNLERSTLKESKRIDWFSELPVWRIQTNDQSLGSFLYGEASLPLLDLELVMLADTDALLYQQFTMLGWVVCGYSALFWVSLFLYRRVTGYRQLLYTRNALEKEVIARTSELESAHQALLQSAKLATIGQMSASVNHEINQPLSAINAYLASCRRLIYKEEFDSAVATLNTVESMVERVHKIVGQLKQFSRTNTDSLSWCKWSDCINGAMVVVGPQINQHKVQVSVQPFSGLVWGEQLKLEQVLVNLLSNAVDAMQHQANKRIDISFESEVDIVNIHVADSGTGISGQTIDTIFEPFFTTKSENGLGLGLSVSRSILESFGGTLLACNNANGKGATFTLRLKKQPIHQ